MPEPAALCAHPYAARRTQPGSYTGSALKFRAAPHA
jgi:hypothetical protein